SLLARRGLHDRVGSADRRRIPAACLASRRFIAQEAAGRRIAIMVSMKTSGTLPQRLSIASTVNGKGPGLHQVALDLSSGAMEIVDATQGQANNPLYIAADPGAQRLYVADFIKDYQGQQGGGIHAYAIDPATGKLTYLNGQPVGGKVP